MKKPHFTHPSLSNQIASIAPMAHRSHGPSLPWLAIVALVTVLFGHRLTAQILETAGGSLSWQATTSPREVVFNAKVFIRYDKFLSPYSGPRNIDVIFRCLDAAGVLSTEPLEIGKTIDLQQNIWAATPSTPAGNLTLSVREGASDIKNVSIRYLKISAMKDGFMECELLDPAWINNAPPGSNRRPQDGPTGVLYHLPGEGRYLAWLKGWERLRQDAAVNRSYLNSGFSDYTGLWEMETIAYAGAGTASPVAIKAPPVIHVPYGGAGTKRQHLLRAEVPQGLTLKWRDSAYQSWRDTVETLADPNISSLNQERMESHLTQAPASGQPGHPDNTFIPFSITPDGVLQWKIFQVGTGFGTPDKFWSFQVMAIGVDAANNEVVKTPYDFMVLLDQNGTNRIGLSRAMVAIDCAPRQMVTLGDWVEFSVVGIGVSDQPNEAITLSREGTLPTGISDYTETLLLSGADNIVKKKIRFRAAQLGSTALNYRAATDGDSGSYDTVSATVEVLPKIEGYYVYSTSMDYLNPNNPGAYSVATAIVQDGRTTGYAQSWQYDYSGYSLRFRSWTSPQPYFWSPYSFPAYPLSGLDDYLPNSQANVRSFAINYGGQVAGSMELWGPRKGFRLGGSGPTGLDTLDPSIGAAQSEALGLNNAGMAVGWATRGNGVRRATYWLPGSSQSRDLRTLKSAGVFDPPAEQGLYSSAMGIYGNRIVGASINRDNLIHGFVLNFDPQTLSDLDSAQDIGSILGCRSEGISEARAVNGIGEHAGAATARNGQYHAFLRIPGQIKDCGFTDLGVLSSPSGNGSTVFGTSSIAMALNNYGVVVGNGHEPLTGSYSAFVWLKGWPMLRRLDELVYPTTPGWQLKEAYGVNDSGMIVGWGYYYGIPRGFVAVQGAPPP